MSEVEKRIINEINKGIDKAREKLGVPIGYVQKVKINNAKRDGVK
jgi:hypothetical protein